MDSAHTAVFMGERNIRTNCTVRGLKTNFEKSVARNIQIKNDSYQEYLTAELDRKAPYDINRQGILPP